MDTYSSTFFNANAKQSQAIYQAFYSGAVVNRKAYQEAKADFIETPEYKEIVANMKHYEQLYWHLGYVLTHDQDGDYFYLKAASDSEEGTEDFDESSLKIMATLTILARMATSRGQSISTLMLPIQGITQTDIDALDADSETLSMLRALKLKDGADALAYLKKRGFAFRVDSKRHVLSKGASAMIEVIIARQKSLNSDDEETVLA